MASSVLLAAPPGARGAHALGCPPHSSARHGRARQGSTHAWLGKVWSAGVGGQCVWYSQCGTNPASGQQGNCPFNGTAQALDPSSAKLLSDTCPELVNDLESDSSGNLLTCCDGGQITAMASQLQLGTAFLDRCPTCVRNFRLTFCYMTCSPNQTDFMSINETQEAPDTNKTIITVLDTHLTTRFVDAIYESCKDVLMPSSNSKAMSVMCGSWGTLYCSGPRLFEFMGSNPLAPFTVNYLFTVICLPRTTPTHVAAWTALPPAPARPLPPPPSPFTLFGVDGLAVVMGVVFLLLASTFLTVYLCMTLRTRSIGISSGPHNKAWGEEPGCLERAGAWMDSSLETFFTAWGTACARYPWVVVVVGVAVTVGLSCGILHLQVTTDPSAAVGFSKIKIKTRERVL
ncbi:hypothetical protein O3P69_019135 [Scylla paramamosain]|uniref:Niemann-Pick C1 N-terminal domain-containing protein n=1 Tax=Scylla paramamosain TaxID=85552 RepID=A0AAW0SWM0_SCYPA